MKLFLSIFIFIICFQPWTKAGDIKDFEIEGISIGDSALDYFSKTQIKNNSYTYPGSDKYIITINVAVFEYAGAWEKVIIMNALCCTAVE